VALGDNSTCTDICGILFGDGTSCLVEETAYYDCSVYERQEVKISGNLTGKYMTGLYRLGFNGKMTEELSIFASEEEIEIALNGLNSVGVVRVEPLTYNMISDYSMGNVTSDGYSGVYSINYGVEFRAEKVSSGERRERRLELFVKSAGTNFRCKGRLVAMHTANFGIVCFAPFQLFFQVSPILTRFGCFGPFLCFIICR
jgi:hypothetical protein